MLIVGWLGLRNLLFEGPSVTVRFEAAGGVEAGNTKVKYNGMVVGQVDSVVLEKDLDHVDVNIQFHSDMGGHLGPGTRYWIAGEDVTLANLSSIKSAIAGPDIVVDPHPGDTVDKTDGLPKPPVIKDRRRGREFVLETSDIRNVSRDTPIYFHGDKAGEVLSYSIDVPKQQFRITAFVREPLDDLIKTDTRFWEAGPVHLTTTPSGPSVDFQSLPALVKGAIAFETPADAPGPPSPKDTVFQLYSDKDTARNAPGADGVAYSVVFGNQQSNLPVGAPVQLIDTPIGSVSSSTLEYDAVTGRLDTRATIVIAARKLHILNGGTNDPRARIDDMMRHMIAQGLRAEIAKATPVVGGEIVRLHFVPAAPSATLAAGSPPSIPTQAGSGVDLLMTKANDIMDKVNGMPIDQIADEVHTATQQLATVSKSPELTKSLGDLQQSLQNVRGITAETQRNVRPILAEVQQAAASAQDAVRAARAVLSSNAGGGSNNATQTAALPDTLYELGRAARSLRELADYLEQHPEALIAGKGSHG